MSGCDKYVVVDLNKLSMSEIKGGLQNWLNYMYEENKYELVAIRGNEFIFTKNAYIVQIKHVQDFLEE